MHGSEIASCIYFGSHLDVYLLNRFRAEASWYLAEFKLLEMFFCLKTADKLKCISML